MSKAMIPDNNAFDAVISIIENARGRALKAVNAELIHMYWDVGEYLSGLCAESSFGDKVIDEVASYISRVAPTVRGLPVADYTGCGSFMRHIETMNLCQHC